MKRLVASLALYALLGGSVAYADNSYETCLRSRTNSERISRGIPALKIDVRIDKIARDHSDRMARDGTIYHNEHLSDELPPYEYAGENVAMGPVEGNDGPGGESGCDLIHAAFMSSKGHRANILDRDYQYVGIGVTLDTARETIYATVDFFTPKQSSPSKKPTTGTTPRTRCTCPP